MNMELPRPKSTSTPYSNIICVPTPQKSIQFFGIQIMFPLFILKDFKHQKSHTIELKSQPICISYHPKSDYVVAGLANNQTSIIGIG